jgi:hypothetical protein
MISALSGSSSVIFLILAAENTEEKEFYSPICEKNHKPQRAGRTQRMKY